MKARTEALNKASAEKDPEKIREIIKNMNGEDLQKYIEDGNGDNITDELVRNIRGNQLKDMDGMEDKYRKKIGDMIDSWDESHKENHSAHDFVDKNKSIWLSSKKKQNENDGSGI